MEVLLLIVLIFNFLENAQTVAVNSDNVFNDNFAAIESNKVKLEPSFGKTSFGKTSGPIDSSQCLLYLPFNDNVTDLSAYKQTVEPANTTVDQTVRARGYGSLNMANNSYLEIPSLAGHNFGLDVTFCVYFRHDSKEDNGELLSNLDEGTGKFSIKILANLNGTYQVWLQHNDGVVYSSQNLSISNAFKGNATDPTLPTRFNLICVVFDGTYVRIWRNRELVENEFFDGRLAVSNAPFRIGKGFRGYIDDVLICKRAFTDYDIGAVWSGRRSLEIRGFLPLSVGAKDDKPYLKITAQPSPNGCGHTASWKPADLRIVGGFRAEANELPYQVFLEIRFNTSWYSCGGSIIGNRWILTAAHCVTDGRSLTKPDEVRVYAGLLLFSEAHSATFRKIQNQSHITPHPDWNGHNGSPRGLTDFALLFLEDPLKYDSLVQPICLPKSCSDESLCSANETVIISGYGLMTDRTRLRPRRLLKAYVSILSDEACQEMAEASRVPHWNTTEHRLFCTHSPTENDISACRGDSGGPVACYGSGYFMLQGVTSMTWSCSEPGIPQYFGKVCDVREWINQITGL